LSHGPSFISTTARAYGMIIADVRLSERRFIPFDVSEESGQREVLDAIERNLESRHGGQRAR
jgi:hypothetical protein